MLKIQGERTKYGFSGCSHFLGPVTVRKKEQLKTTPQIPMKTIPWTKGTPSATEGIMLVKN